MNSPSKVPLVLISYISSVLRRVRSVAEERGDGDEYGVSLQMGVPRSSRRYLSMSSKSSGMPSWNMVRTRFSLV